MKKVLSVLLAAAMVMGMSVSAMARPTVSSTTEVIYGGSTTNTNYANAADMTWHDCMVVRDGVVLGAGYANDLGDFEIEAGDELYFLIQTGNAEWNTSIPSGWKLKLSNAAHVKSGELMVIDATTTGASNTINNYFWADIEDKMYTTCAYCDNDAVEHFHAENAGKLLLGDYKFWNGKVWTGNKILAAKIVMDEDFDHFTTADEEIKFYVYDSKHNTKSDEVSVEYAYSNYAKVTLVEDDLDWVITVDEPTAYTYKKGETAAKATIDFDGLALGEFKMWAEEVYTLYASSKYNKTLSKEYDTDVEVITFTLGNAEGIDVVFPAAKDAYQVVAVVDGELVPVEATYVEDHKFASGKVTDGYFVENLEAGQYAVIDASIEIVEEEVEEPATEPEVPAEPEKANPETGAADFVGAAVAMAVVSVAAAGALALKK